MYFLWVASLISFDEKIAIKKNQNGTPVKHEPTVQHADIQVAEVSNKFYRLILLRGGGEHVTKESKKKQQPKREKKVGRKIVSFSIVCTHIHST